MPLAGGFVLLSFCCRVPAPGEVLDWCALVICQKRATHFTPGQTIGGIQKDVEIFATDIRHGRSLVGLAASQNVLCVLLVLIVFVKGR